MTVQDNSADLRDISITTIQQRHLADAEFADHGRFKSEQVAEQAHQDRGALLKEIARLTEKVTTSAI